MMNNGRDCIHGRQVGKCDTCDLIEAEKEIEALKAQVERLREEKAQAVRDVIKPLSEEELSLLICNADQGDWNSLIYRDCWKRGFTEGFREREEINQLRQQAKAGE